MSWVTGHNGVRLRVREAGRGDGPAVLLVHGWSQHSLCWKFQFESLADRFHLVALDLRGHGESDTPLEAEAYNRSEPWSGDIAAVIDQMGLDRPLLVGWSMGGWVVADYLRLHGDAGISGVCLVGSSITTGTRTPQGIAEGREEAVRAVGMNSDDQAENIASTMAFLKACTARPLAPDLFAEMVGLNMLCPPHARLASRRRDEDYRETYRNLQVPLQVIWGTAERVALRPYTDEILSTVPGAELAEMAGLGHAPFLEDPARFDAALAGFAHRAFAERTAA